MRRDPSSLLDYARSVSQVRRGAEGPEYSLLCQVIGRLFNSPMAIDEISSEMDIGLFEMRQIVSGLTGLGSPLLRQNEDVCTFCGTPRADTIRMFDGRGVHICKSCVGCARCVADGQESELGSGLWTFVSPLGDSKCDFCGRRKVAGACVPAAYAHICERCLEECERCLGECESKGYSPPA